MNFLDLFGYLSSFIILVSLTMSSIIKLRWINLVGAALFTIYGVMLKSVPTAFLNFGIVIIDIYYLFKLYSKKEDFKLVEVSEDSELLEHFYKNNGKELLEYFGDNKIGSDEKVFFMLRNNYTAGILIGTEEKETLKIKVDFVTEKYRDFRLGSYFFNENTEELKKRGYKKVYSKALHEKHKEYLEKIGFKMIDKDLYEKVL